MPGGDGDGGHDGRAGFRDTAHRETAAAQRDPLAHGAHAVPSAGRGADGRVRETAPVAPDGQIR